MTNRSNMGRMESVAENPAVKLTTQASIILLGLASSFILWAVSEIYENQKFQNLKTVEALKENKELFSMISSQQALLGAATERQSDDLRTIKNSQRGIWQRLGELGRKVVRLESKHEREY